MKDHKYIRDGRNPVPQSESISRVMSANRGRDTGPEILLRKALNKAGLSGYRLHWKNAPGRPDITYPGRKIAIFVNGCFWHRCPSCSLPLPKTNIDFWKDKFHRNIERDKRKLKELKNAGWVSLVIWECEIQIDIDTVVDRVRKIHGEG